MVNLPQNCHLNGDAPLSVEALINGTSLGAPQQPSLLSDYESQQFTVESRFEMPAATGSEVEMELFLPVVYCSQGNESACHVATIGWKVPVRISADEHQSVIELSADIA